jgi:hypothetical protein
MMRRPTMLLAVTLLAIGMTGVPALGDDTPILHPSLESEEACKAAHPDEEIVRYERRDDFIGCSYATPQRIWETDTRFRTNRRGTIQGTLTTFTIETAYQGLRQFKPTGDEWEVWSWYRERTYERDLEEWSSCTVRSRDISTRVCDNVFKHRR